jgi:hypothetical protein
MNNRLLKQNQSRHFGRASKSARGALFWRLSTMLQLNEGTDPRHDWQRVMMRCAKLSRTEAIHEVNIFDRRPDPTYGTGAIVDVAKVSPMPKAGGQWNT